MSQYMLLLYDNRMGWQNLSPEEMQKAIEKYHDWMHKPFNKDGKRLADDLGRVVRSDNGKPRVADGPYSETKEVLGGFYLIVGSSRVDLQACKLEYSIVSPK